MHKHECGCKHQLEFCNHCDVVYCKKCGKEWKYNFYNQWTYTYPSATSTKTIPDWNGGTTFTNSASVGCVHH